MHIDIASYPHIFDLILSYAPPPSLVALRAVSRALHARADALLFTHMAVLFPPDEAGFISIRSVHSPVTLKWLRYGTGAKSRDQRRARTRKHVHHLVEAARCIGGLLEGWAHAPPAAQAALIGSTLKLSANTTLRIVGTSPNWSQPKGARAWCAHLLAEREVIALCQLSTLPLAPQRLVQRLSLSPGAMISTEVQDLGKNYAPARVIHLLWEDHSEPPAGGDVARWESNLLQHLILAGTSLGADITIVGGGEELRAFLGLARDMPKDQFESALEVHANAMSWLGWLDDETESGDEVVDHVATERFKDIHFLTPDEYVELVGVEQATLETQSDPMAKVPATYLP